MPTSDTPAPEFTKAELQRLANMTIRAESQGTIAMLAQSHLRVIAERDEAIRYADHRLWALTGVLTGRVSGKDAEDHAVGALERFRERYPTPHDAAPRARKE